jgi:hypothetical protein
MELQKNEAAEIVCRLLGWSLLASRIISFSFIGVGCATPNAVRLTYREMMDTLK